jgi:hypothetical protein
MEACSLEAKDGLVARIEAEKQPTVNLCNRNTHCQSYITGHSCVLCGFRRISRISLVGVAE